MAIYLSDDAVSAAGRLQIEHPEWAGLPLRLYIEGKGCDGFYYGVSFDAATCQDQVVFSDRKSGLQVIADSDTLTYVQDAHIAWVDDERGRGFLVDNPQQRAYRGKFYKRAAWLERLATKGCGG